MRTAPQHRMEYDKNYNRVRVPTTPEDRRRWLATAAREWETKAQDLEQSADRRAARCDHEGAASNLALAQDYRREADRCRAEAEQEQD